MEAAQPRQKLMPRWLSPMFFVFLLYAVFFLPFWKPLLLGFLFACALGPVVRFLRSRFNSGRKATSLYLITGLIALFLIALAFGGIRIYSIIYEQFKNPEAVTSQLDQASSVRVQVVEWLKKLPFVTDSQIDQQLDAALSNIGTKARELAAAGATAFVVKTPQILANLLIFLTAMGVFSVWGNNKWTFLGKFLGRENPADCEDFMRFERICSISIGSIFLTGLIQAGIVGIGSAIAGYPFFLSFLIAFILSLIPVIGAASVPVFLAILSYATGSVSGAIIMAITAIIAGSSDNIIRAYLFSRAANTNPIVSLLALLGGISLFGFVGLFMAPVVEQLVMSYLQRQESEKEQEIKQSAPRNATLNPSLQT